jgi:hypothetical protein
VIRTATSCQRANANEEQALLPRAVSSHGEVTRGPREISTVAPHGGPPASGSRHPRQSGSIIRIINYTSYADGGIPIASSPMTMWPDLVVFDRPRAAHLAGARFLQARSAARGRHAVLCSRAGATSSRVTSCEASSAGRTMLRPMEKASAMQRPASASGGCESVGRSSSGTHLELTRVGLLAPLFRLLPSGGR